MSLAITLFVREGIVMAADSRLSVNIKKFGPNQTFPMSNDKMDSNYNVFATESHVGISTYGLSNINGTPVASHVDSLVHTVLNPNMFNVDQTADELLRHFQNLKPEAGLYFHVAGYNKENEEQIVLELSVLEGHKQILNTPSPHAAIWRGETDILDRIFLPAFLAEKDAAGKYHKYHDYKIPWDHISLKDAATFAISAISTTENTIRFQPRLKTVGGAIDVLTITHEGVNWVQHKENAVSELHKEGYFASRHKKVIKWNEIGQNQPQKNNPEKHEPIA